MLWTAPFGGRAAPLVMDGRIYVQQGFGEGLAEAERVVCLEEKTGKKLWEYAVPIFHSDVVSSRLGWTPLTADPATGYVYANTTAGDLLCLDKTGKLVWSRQLTEEFGRFTGYGGRIAAPIFDSGVVVIGIISSAWGDMARGANRFYAFDGKTGQVVWIADPGLPVRSTYQSNPVIAVIGGQRLFISAGGDGALHAFKVRTGEKVWSYPFSAGAANPSPVVDGNFVYCAHGEENLDSPTLGRVICVDASQVDAEDEEAEARVGVPEVAAVRAVVAGTGRRRPVRARRQRRAVRVRREERQGAVEVPLRHGGPRRAAGRGQEALHLRREGEAVDHAARRQEQAGRTCSSTSSARSSRASRCRRKPTAPRSR